jgi:hypothetical protein
MKVKDHLPLAELERLERVEKDAHRAKRLRIILLGIEGWTAVAMAVGLSRRICQRWVQRYHELGLAGLDDLRGGESRLPLSPRTARECLPTTRRRTDGGGRSLFAQRQGRPTHFGPRVEPDRKLGVLPQEPLLEQPGLRGLRRTRTSRYRRLEKSRPRHRTHQIRVCGALSQSRYFRLECVLVVLYDEHGGFFDHVEPPVAIAPDSHQVEWNFERLGLRVPALAVSSWFDKRVESTIFDHTCLLKYVTEKWGVSVPHKTY